MGKKWYWFIPAILVVGVVCVSLGPSWANEASMNARPEEEKEVSMTEVPDQVKEIILKEAGNNKIEDIEVSKHGHVLIYEADWLVGDKDFEIQVAYLCKLIKRTMQPADDDDEDSDEEGDDEDEVEYHEKDVSFNQVPAPVRDAILKSAGKNKVLEIEEVVSSYGKVYEAGWISKGWEIEIMLSPDGKLIRKEMEIIHDDDDDEDDDDEDDDDDDD